MKGTILLAVAAMAFVSCHKQQTAPASDEQNDLTRPGEKSVLITKKMVDSTGIYHNILLDSALAYALGNRDRSREHARTVITKVYGRYYPVDIATVENAVPSLLTGIKKSPSYPLERLDRNVPGYDHFATLIKIVNNKTTRSYEQVKGDLEALTQKVEADLALSARIRELLLGSLSVAGHSADRWYNLATLGIHLELYIPILFPGDIIGMGGKAVSADTRAYLDAKLEGHSEHVARMLSAIASVDEFLDNLWPF